jgi:hypothetical protein
LVNWAPPADWQDISNTAINQIKYLVADTNLTYAFKATTSTGTYTIDWGDGTIDSACVSGTQYQHTYVRGAGVACSRGYTTFVISIKPNTGNLLTCQIAKHTLLTVKQSHDILYANIKNATFLNDYSSMFSVSGVVCPRLESVIMPTLWSDAATNANYMFGNCYSLQSVTLPTSFGNMKNISNIFYNCYSLKSITFPSSFGSITDISSAFGNCYSLQSVTLPTSWGVVKDASYTFYNCSSLQSVTLPTSLGVTTSVSNIFSGCSPIQYNAGMQYLGSQTSPCDFTSAFISNQNIEGSLTFGSSMYKFTFAGTSGNVNHITGLTLTNTNSSFAGSSPQIDIAYNNLDTKALTDLANSLPAVSGKTIRITGCKDAGVGPQSYDTIFTNKGWAINRTT